MRLKRRERVHGLLLETSKLLLGNFKNIFLAVIDTGNRHKRTNNKEEKWKRKKE